MYVPRLSELFGSDFAPKRQQPSQVRACLQGGRITLAMGLTNGIHGTLISTLFDLNLKEKPKVDAHLQCPLQDSGTMYPYLLEKWIL